METTGNSTELTDIAGWAVQLMEQLGGSSPSCVLAILQHLRAGAAQG
ncbi:hypothetical protein [Nocardia sp. XZ_19_231]|nr:hypothetical protein [Nocardia sp. XZ_19_231]